MIATASPHAWSDWARGLVSVAASCECCATVVGPIAMARRGVARMSLAFVLCGCAAAPVPLRESTLVELSHPDELRVFPSHRLIVVYPPDPEVGKSSKALKLVLGRRIAGAVVDVEGDHERLFVTFDPQCEDRGCAYVFARGGVDEYRLVRAPPLVGYAPPRTYRGAELPGYELRRDLAGGESAPLLLPARRGRAPRAVSLDGRVAIPIVGAAEPLVCR
jgi:hypothetical protein